MRLRIFQRSDLVGLVSRVLTNDFKPIHRPFERRSQPPSESIEILDGHAIAPNRAPGFFARGGRLLSGRNRELSLPVPS
jgi:hypothetical protein